MKTLPFFKFDAESWLTGKVQLLPVDHIGIFINLTARIWKAGGAVRNDRFLPRLLGASPEQFAAAMQDFIDLEIVTEVDGFLRIKFLDGQLAERRDFVAKCAEGGRKARKGTMEAPSSNLEGTLSDLETPSTNKKEERREKIEDIREENNNAPALDAVKVLGAELAEDFGRWLAVWRDTHGCGRDMQVFQQAAQLRMLHSLPETIRKEAIEAATRGAWKAIHDIRKPRQGERPSGAPQRNTGVLSEAPTFSSNERGIQ